MALPPCCSCTHHTPVRQWLMCLHHCPPCGGSHPWTPKHPPPSGWCPLALCVWLDSSSAAATFGLCHVLPRVQQANKGHLLPLCTLHRCLILTTHTHPLRWALQSSGYATKCAAVRGTAWGGGWGGVGGSAWQSLCRPVRSANQSLPVSAGVGVGGAGAVHGASLHAEGACPV